MWRFSITAGPILIVALLVIFILAINADAKKDGVHHCNDKVRELIMESCKNLNAAYKLRRENRQTHGVSKRANNDADFNANENDIKSDPDDFKIEFLEDKRNKTLVSLPKGRHLYTVQKASFPDAYLIVNHRNAKIFNQFYGDKIEERQTVYRNVGGRLVTDHQTIHHKRVAHKSNRHRRDNKKVTEKISACCASDLSCMAALCIARS